MTRSKGNADYRWDCFTLSYHVAKNGERNILKFHLNILWIDEFMNLSYLKEQTNWATP